MNKENRKQEVIFGRHPVLEALKAGRPLQRLLIARGTRGAIVDEIFTQARLARIPYDVVEREFLDRAAGTQHQGIVAHLAAHAYANFDQILNTLDHKKAFLVFLDGIQDPHNLGAIIRSAHAVRADALVLQERGAAGLSGTAIKAAAGAAAYMPVCRVGNLRHALLRVREAGLWIAGLEVQGAHIFTEVDFRGPCALVIGSESKGLRRMVGQTCDFQVGIPMGRSEVGSFNASVAASLVLYEVFRQRHLDG